MNHIRIAELFGHIAAHANSAQSCSIDASGRDDPPNDVHRAFRAYDIQTIRGILDEAERELTDSSVDERIVP